MRHLPLILLAAALCAGDSQPQPGQGPGPGGPPGQRPPGPSPEELFQKADANKDGKVTLEELTAAVEARVKAEREALFARIDANGDGNVSKEEFLAFEPPGPQGPPGQGPPGQGPPGEGPPGQGPPGEGKGVRKQQRRGGPDPAEMFKRFDRNGDGIITADEVKRPEGREGREGRPEGRPEGKPGKPDDPLAP